MIDFIVTEDSPIDEVAIERALEGDVSVTLNAAEMRAVWDLLEGQHLSANQISVVLGVSVRSVRRWRRGRCSPSARTGGELRRAGRLRAVVQ